MTRVFFIQFEQKANEVVEALPWVKNVNVTMSAQPAKPAFAGELPKGLQQISNIIAVSSCKVVLFTVLLNSSIVSNIKTKLLRWIILTI